MQNAKGIILYTKLHSHTFLNCRYAGRFVATEQVRKYATLIKEYIKEKEHYLFAMIIIHFKFDKDTFVQLSLIKRYLSEYKRNYFV